MRTRRRKEASASALIACVAANVTRLRKARGLTVTELSERSGLHMRHLQKFLAGELNATLTTLGTVAAALEVAPGELLAPVPEESPKRARRVGRPLGLRKTAPRG